MRWFFPSTTKNEWEGWWKASPRRLSNWHSFIFFSSSSSWCFSVVTTPTLFCEYGDEGRGGGGGGERGGRERSRFTVSSDSVDLASKGCDVCDVVCHGHKCWTRNLAYIWYITYFTLINVDYIKEEKEKRDEKEERVGSHTKLWNG